MTRPSFFEKILETASMLPASLVSPISGGGMSAASNIVREILAFCFGYSFSFSFRDLFLLFDQ
jgi:hypothetical protein